MTQPQISVLTGVWIIRTTEFKYKAVYINTKYPAGWIEMRQPSSPVPPLGGGSWPDNVPMNSQRSHIEKKVIDLVLTKVRMVKQVVDLVSQQGPHGETSGRPSAHQGPHVEKSKE